MKIGLFGGSFDPAHSGHAHVAEIALKRLQLDYVWWVPALGNPLKSTETLFQKRFASAEIMAHGRNMRVTNIEDQLQLNYTNALIQRLKAMAPEAHFVWIMGGDNLLNFHHWQGWKNIAETVPIAAVSRPGAGPRARFSKFASVYRHSRILDAQAASLPLRGAPHWVHLRAPLNWESSTRLREAKAARDKFLAE
jgi:nicotinate-nucleotide adenylyltransferase